jgi:hypothetical protein
MARTSVPSTYLPSRRNPANLAVGTETGKGRGARAQQHLILEGEPNRAEPIRAEPSRARFLPLLLLHCCPEAIDAAPTQAAAAAAEGAAKQETQGGRIMPIVSRGRSPRVILEKQLIGRRLTLDAGKVDALRALNECWHYESRTRPTRKTRSTVAPRLSRTGAIGS